MARLFVAWTAALVFIGGIMSLPARGDDFRVETKISSSKEAKASSENLTLFRAGRVYDFLTEFPAEDKKDAKENKQISIFDPHAGRMVLIDPSRRVRTELKCERLIELTASLKSRATQQSDPLLKFAADPKFAETAGSTGDDLTFSSAPMTYRVRTQKASSAEAARQYREFTDAYARLNVITNPGSIPPFPRLIINEALGKRDLVPKEVDLSIAARSRLGGKPTLRHSEHLFHWRLLDADQRRIDDVAESLVTFELVDLETYLRAPADAAKLSASGGR